MPDSSVLTAANISEEDNSHTFPVYTSLLADLKAEE